MSLNKMMRNGGSWNGGRSPNVVLNTDGREKSNSQPVQMVDIKESWKRILKNEWWVQLESDGLGIVRSHRLRAPGTRASRSGAVAGPPTAAGTKTTGRVAPSSWCRRGPRAPAPCPPPAAGAARAPGPRDRRGRCGYGCAEGASSRILQQFRYALHGAAE
jgi:hypothetical protein